MDKNSNILSIYVKTMYSAGRLLLYRNEEELSFLKGWLTGTGNSGMINIPEPGEIDQANNIQNCTLCEDVTNKKPGWGSGINGIMIIMNTPQNLSSAGKKELKHESLDLLNKMIAAINLDLKECYVTNLIKCEPGNTVSRPGMMLKNCAPNLTREITDYNPKIIIVMGEITPLNRLINQYNNISWYNIDHPVNILKNPELKKPAWITLKKIIADLNNTGNTVKNNE